MKIVGFRYSWVAHQQNMSTWIIIYIEAVEGYLVDGGDVNAWSFPLLPVLFHFHLIWCISASPKCFSPIEAMEINRMEWAQFTATSSCYAFSSRALSYILFQSCNHSVHRNVCSDDHMITFMAWCLINIRKTLPFLKWRFPIWSTKHWNSFFQNCA
jgi:hypothetical protein